MNYLKQLKKDIKQKSKKISNDWIPDFTNKKQEKFF